MRARTTINKRNATSERRRIVDDACDAVLKIYLFSIIILISIFIYLAQLDLTVVLVALFNTLKFTLVNVAA